MVPDTIVDHRRPRELAKPIIESATTWAKELLPELDS